MYLNDLFAGIATTSNTFITGLSLDSRNIFPGYLFIAISSEAAKYIPIAIQKGARAILSNQIFSCTSEVIYHPYPYLIAHILAARFFSNQPLNITAVTGTNGKTSIVNFCKQLYELTGKLCASIGTLGVKCTLSDLEEVSTLTTPDCVNLHRILDKLAHAKIQNVILEASSHALSQYRMHSVRLKSAAFSNLSYEHLDYHQTLESYFNAKLKLFTEILPRDAKVIINTDDITSSIMLKQSLSNPSRIIEYGYNAKHFKIKQQIPFREGQIIQFSVYNKSYKLYLPLLGRFQLHNILCAFALSNISIEDINLEKLTAIPGRMNLLNIKDRYVVIDYAHTPHALQHCLKEIRWHFSHSKLILVFGCGGNRDKGKRLLMGKIAAQYADKVIICDDNPRYESPELIRDQILQGCKGGLEIGDRKKAIYHAIHQAASKQDVVVIAGKGHETTQIYSDITLMHNDRDYLNTLI